MQAPSHPSPTSEECGNIFGHTFRTEAGVHTLSSRELDTQLAITAGEEMTGQNPSGSLRQYFRLGKSCTTQGYE